MSLLDMNHEELKAAATEAGIEHPPLAMPAEDAEEALLSALIDFFDLSRFLNMDN